MWSGLGNYRLYFLGSVDTADQNDTGRERLLASGSCPLKTAGSFALVMRWGHSRLYSTNRSSDGASLAFQFSPDSFQPQSTKCLLPSQEHQQRRNSGNSLFPSCSYSPHRILFFQIFRYLCYQFLVMCLDSCCFCSPDWSLSNKIVIRSHWTSSTTHRASVFDTRRQGHLNIYTPFGSHMVSQKWGSIFVLLRRQCSGVPYYKLSTAFLESKFHLKIVFWKTIYFYS